MMKEKFIDICETSRLVGASCIIANDHKIIESMQMGYSDLETEKKTKATTVYRIASISKVIVGLMFMRLVEQGKAKIDADISDYLGFKVRNPRFKDIVITPEMLMVHTSSICDGKDDDSTGYNAINGTHRDVPLKELLLENGSLFSEDTYSNNKPGTTFTYSNFCCGILTCIIEKITNRLFCDYVREELFMPLGLDASFKISDIINDDIATLYYPDGEGVRIARTKDQFLKGQYPNFTIGDNYRGTAGGLFINMVDLSRIMQLFFGKNQTIIKQQTIDTMLAIHWQGQEVNGPYREKGLQIHILKHFPNVILKGHFGDAYGVKSFLFFDEVKKIGICFITNGGHYKYQSFGISDVHEKILLTFIDVYGMDR